MYVCVCHDVNDKTIKKAMNHGYDTLADLQQYLKVTTCCGCCEPMVKDLLNEHHHNNVKKLEVLPMPI